MRNLKKVNPQKAERKAALDNLRRLRTHINHMNQLYRRALDHLLRVAALASVILFVDEALEALGWGW